MTENATQSATPTPPTDPRVDRIGRWLMPGANIGVLLGLVILIVEIRQNEALMRVATEGPVNKLMVITELHLAQPAQSAASVKSYMAPDTMTDAFDHDVVRSATLPLGMTRVFSISPLALPA